MPRGGGPVLLSLAGYWAPRVILMESVGYQGSSHWHIGRRYEGLELKHPQREPSGFCHSVRLPRRIPNKVHFYLGDTIDSCDFFFDLDREGACNGTHGRGEGHRNDHGSGRIVVDFVYEAKLINVNGYFGIVAGPENLDDLGLEVGRRARSSRFVFLFDLDAVLFLVIHVSFGPSLSGYLFFSVVECRFQRVPRKSGTFDTDRELLDTGKYRELTKVLRILILSRHDTVK